MMDFSAAFSRGQDVAWSYRAFALPQTARVPDFWLCAAQTNESDRTPLPRRLQPRLGTGFEDSASDGLREFDRSVPSWLHDGASRRAIAGGAVAVIVLAVIVVVCLS